jgi:AraC-like DNA-binding protein
MPIYMDRHDVSKAVTAEIVAQIHQQDLKIQHKYNCRGLTYWFDDARKTAFCLVEAPNKEAIVEMHDHAHGEVPHQIIEVDAHIVESFLGRIEDPEKAQNTQLNIINDPAFRIIMIISQEVDSFKEINSPGHKNLNKRIITTLESFDGKIVQKRNNEFLVSFKSVSNAVLCAIKIKEHFAGLKLANQNENIFLKIGLNCGIPVTEKLSIFEDTIRLAERMKYISENEIVVSSEVKELYKSENQNSFFESKTLLALTPDDEVFITSLMEFVEKEWQNPNLKAEDFHTNLGLSKSKLYREMILLTGKSLNTFLLQYRLNQSLKLLQNQKGSISEIAFDSGFNSPSYFTKCFRGRYKVMPSEYLHFLQSEPIFS